MVVTIKIQNGTVTMLPSLDDVRVIAVNAATNVRPKLTTQEEAFFIAGFQECVKCLHVHPNTITLEIDTAKP